MTEAIEIDVRNIALRELLSPRDGIEWNVVEEYANNIADLPPILVAIDEAADVDEPRVASIDGKTYVLIDGWHRYHAHKGSKKQTISAVVEAELQPKDFFFRAICANKAHGIRFTAAEKKQISKYLFMRENRSAAEISQAIGCSVRHATDLIKSLVHEKKAIAIRIAKTASAAGVSERDIAKQLKKLGIKASKSGVHRWLQPESKSMDEHLTIREKIDQVPQIGESPKRDTEQLVNEGGQPIDDEGRILNLDGEVATVAPMRPEPKTRIGVCPKCKTRTVRVPTKEAVASCTRLFFYCDKCKEYIWLFRLLEQLT